MADQRYLHVDRPDSTKLSEETQTRLQRFTQHLEVGNLDRIETCSKDAVLTRRASLKHVQMNLRSLAVRSNSIVYYLVKHFEQTKENLETRFGRRLESLTIEGEIIKPGLLEYAQQRRTIRILKLNDCRNWTMETVAMLATAIGSLASLKTIKLCDNAEEFASEASLLLFKALALYPSLTQIKSLNVPELTTSFLTQRQSLFVSLEDLGLPMRSRRIHEMIPHIGKLQRLEMHAELTEELLEALFGATLESVPLSELKNITLSFKNNTVVSPAMLLSTTQRNRGLEQLNLSFDHPVFTTWPLAVHLSDTSTIVAWPKLKEADICLGG